jgi:phospholipase/carboxylesterase
MFTTVRQPTEAVYQGRLSSAGDSPAGLFVPMNLEPAYAYPLLVFLHDRGEDETAWLERVPALSRRNYVALAPRGPRTVRRRDGTVGFGWGRDRGEDALVEDIINAGLEEVRETVRINPNRVFLVGQGEGAAAALRLALANPTVIAGVAAFDCPERLFPVTVNGRRAGLAPRVLLGCSFAETDQPPALFHLLHAAGLSVTYRPYPESAAACQPTLLRDLNRWVMNG